MNFSFISLLNASISASWLVGVVILLRLVLKKAPKAIHCALWALVAIRLLCPVSIESPFSLVPSTQTVSEYYQTQEAASNGQQTVLDIVENPVYPKDVDIPLDLPAHRMEWSLFEWSIIWPAGMIVMAAYAVFSWLRLRRKVAVSISIARDIRICDYIESPFILGILRPIIYLPSDMDQTAIDHVLAHERAHLTRHDHWWKPLGFALLTVHWFNPILWLAYILLCRDIELACDEKVIRDLGNDQKKAYSTALLQCSVGRSMIAACPLAFGEVGVKERVKTVLNYKKPAFWFVVLAVILCCVVAVCFLTDPLSPDVYDVMYQEGYTVLDQRNHEFDISIPVDTLPDEIYSDEGHTFREKEIVVYQTETSAIWLMHAQYANEGSNKMYFEFSISHNLPKSGSILLSSRVEVGTRNSSPCFRPTSRTLYDGETSFEDAVSIRAHGPGQRFTVYIDTAAAQAAQEELRFGAFMNLLTYVKDGHEAVEIPNNEILQDGIYQAQEKVYWAVHSSLFVYDMEMEACNNALVLRFNEGEWSEGPFPLEANWQTECPISDRYRELLADLSNIEPAFAMEDLSDCRFLNLDAMHFLVEKNSELYVVSWQRSNIGLEIIHYIFHMVPEAEYEEHSGTIHLGYATLETDPVGDAILQTVLQHNPVTPHDDQITTVSYAPLSHATGCGEDFTSEVIHMMVRIVTYEKNEIFLRELDSTDFQAAIEIITFPDAEPEVTAYWQSHTDTMGKLVESFGGFPAEIDPSGTSMMELELECVRQAAAQYNLDAEALLKHLKETTPEYFDLSVAKGIGVYWRDTADGLTCVIAEDTNLVRTGQELDALPMLTSQELWLILRHYPEAEVSFKNLDAAFYADIR